MVLVLLSVGLTVSIYKPRSFSKLQGTTQEQKIMINKFYSCLSDNLILYIIDVVLEISFEFFTLVAVVYFASICLNTAIILGQLNKQLRLLCHSKELSNEKVFEDWKRRHTQLVKAVENVDACVSPFSCYIICTYTYGVLGAIYVVMMWCEDVTTIYSVKVVMKALLPLGTLMMCAVTVDCQVSLGKLLYFFNGPP